MQVAYGFLPAGVMASFNLAPPVGTRGYFFGMGDGGLWADTADLQQQHPGEPLEDLSLHFVSGAEAPERAGRGGAVASSSAPPLHVGASSAYHSAPLHPRALVASNAAE